MELPFEGTAAIQDVEQRSGFAPMDDGTWHSLRNPLIDYSKGQPYKYGLKAGSEKLRIASQNADVRSFGYKTTKRIFDIAMSLIVIAATVVLWPITVIVLVSTAISTKGFPFYTQERVGQNGQIFRLIKLRSMVADSDNVEKYLNEKQMQQWRRERKVDNDSRITKLGAFWRATSLDELSQFLNVLAGQMSVIGPRPVSEEELEWYSDKHKAYLLSVPQGITGWWQVGPRTDATYENHERQDLELYYAGNASWRMDFEVFRKTFGVMFGKDRTGK